MPEERTYYEMPTVDPRDEVFTLEEAAAFLRMSPSWLRNSDMPRSRMGTRVVYLRSQLIAYVSKNLTHRVA